MAARGDTASAEQFFHAGLQRTREIAYYLFYAFFLAKLAEVLAAIGRVDEGLAEIAAAIRHAEKAASPLVHA